MRIAFVGKGGSGKTTLTALFAQYLSSIKLPTLVIDADINQHLGLSLGLNDPDSIKPLGSEIDILKKYLKGNNILIESTDTMIKTTPPGRGSRLVKFAEKNPVFDYFEKKIRNIRFMAVGEFSLDDIGIKCYHSKTGSVELLLNHMIDRSNEYILVDMTAGADSFASGLFTKFDLTLVVVEPTLKSLSVYKQFKKYAADFDIALKAIANKVEDKQDLNFLNKNLGKDLIAIFWVSKFIKNQERGIKQKFISLEKQNFTNLQKIYDYSKSLTRNWEALYQNTIYFHKKNALSWANAQAGVDLTQQIDPHFKFESVL